MNLANGKITASSTRGSKFAAANVLDDSFDTYWTTADGVKNASLTLDLRGETSVDTVMLQENIALGQRVKQFAVQTWNGAEFQTVAQATTIGYKRILKFPRTATTRFRVVIEDAKASPVISTLKLYDSAK